MNTTKKLLIGASALLAVVIGMQAEEKIWERYTLDYKDSGIEKLELRHAVYKADRLDLRNCNLGELVLPVGMIDLRTLDLRGNNNLTNLFIQQDTSIDVTRYPKLAIRLSGNMRKNMKISLPSWLSLWSGLDGFKEVEIRKNGVEIVRLRTTLPFFKDSWVLVWGDGQLQRSVNFKRWIDEEGQGDRRHRGKRRDYYYNSPEPYMLVWGQTRRSWGWRDVGVFYRLKPEPTPITSTFTGSLNQQQVR